MADEKIKSEAREILDKFAKDMAHVKLSDKPFSKKGESFRKEKEGEKCSNEFKTIMFKNAKHKNESYILLEKASW